VILVHIIMAMKKDHITISANEVQSYHLYMWEYMLTELMEKSICLPN